MLTVEYWWDLRVLDSFLGSEQQCNLFTKPNIFCLSPKPFLVQRSNFLAVCANGFSTSSPACHPIPNPLIPVVSPFTCVPVFLTLKSLISYDRSFVIQPFTNSSLSPFMTCLPLPGCLVFLSTQSKAPDPSFQFLITSQLCFLLETFKIV